MLTVEQTFPNGVPQTTVSGFAPRGAAWHWTAGGTGRAGWQGSVTHLVNTRYTVNASYHAGLWCEHVAGHVGCRTIIQWIVPTTKAAHSIAPSQIYVLNANKNQATQQARFVEVRRILARDNDPNADCIAISYAGMPVSLAADLKCPVFRADIQQLARELAARASTDARPHFGHGWIQPISRYEVDEVGLDFIALLYAAVTPPEDDMPTPPLRFKPELWKTSASGADLRRQAVMLTTNKVGFIPPGTVVFTVGETDDGVWRLAVADDPAALGEEDLFWVVRNGPLIPFVQGGDPALLAGIQAVVEARLAGEPVPGDAGAATRIGLAATHLTSAGAELAAAQKALQG